MQARKMPNLEGKVTIITGKYKVLYWCANEKSQVKLVPVIYCSLNKLLSWLVGDVQKVGVGPRLSFLTLQPKTPFTR